jgi:hypothetical protein
MATVTNPFSFREPRGDLLTGTPRAHALDRWIFVFMATWFIAIVFTGFIPDSIMKIGMVRAAQRPPFPIVMHMHAVLMGSFLLLLLTQTWLMATGRRELHMRVGVVAVIVAIVLVIVGFILVPTMYHQTWAGLHSASAPQVRQKLLDLAAFQENVLLMQLRIGTLFPLFLAIGLLARGRNAGLHKRMMILGTAIALPAAIDRITWLPTTFPASPLATDLYTLLAVSPMFAWDVIRNRSIHPAYWIWLGASAPITVLVHSEWNTQGWHVLARQILGT